MKFNFMSKLLPLFSISLIGLIIFSLNQKPNVKLKILIWNTPSISLGTYIAFSVSSGYLLSYLITNSIINSKKPKLQKVNNFKYKQEYIEDQYENEIKYNDKAEQYVGYDNTFIERDIKDPAPTMKAKFRVIGNVEKVSQKHKETGFDYSVDSDIPIDNDIRNLNNHNNYSLDSKNEVADWNDDSYNHW